MTLDDYLKKVYSKIEELKDESKGLKGRSIEDYCLLFANQAKDELYWNVYCFLSYCKGKMNGIYDGLRGKEEYKNAIDRVSSSLIRVKTHYLTLKTLKSQTNIRNTYDDANKWAVELRRLSDERSARYNEAKTHEELDEITREYETKIKALDVKPEKQILDYDSVIKGVSDKELELKNEHDKARKGDVTAYVNEVLIKAGLIDLCVQGISNALLNEDRKRSDKFFEKIIDCVKVDDLTKFLK